MNIVHDIVTEYINGFYSPLDGELEGLRKEAEALRIPIILPETETLILNLMKLRKPCRLLEIGTAVGYSTICFAKAVPDLKIVTLESSKDMYRMATENIEKAGFSDRIHVLFGDASGSLKEMEQNIGNLEFSGFDMVFIDASKGHYQEFWDGCIPLCKKDAVILCDNVLFRGRTASDEFVTDQKHKTIINRMREFVQSITNVDYADTAILTVGDGVSVSVLKG